MKVSILFLYKGFYPEEKKVDYFIVKMPIFKK